MTDASQIKSLQENIENLCKENKKFKDELVQHDWGMQKTNEAIKTLYKDLQRKNKDLKKLDQLKSDFVSTVSHELRTPLAISIEGINLILDGIVGEVGEQQKDLLVTSKENLDRLNTIINDLLDISKIESGKIDLKPRLVDLKIILIKLTEAYRKVVVTKKQTLVTCFPDEAVYLYADGDKIIQVVTNLLNNAHKFTAENGIIKFTLEVKQQEILCSIKDNGMGISQDDIPKLFGKFQQFGRTHGPGRKGTGLGLAISKALVELHKGRIWAESHMPGGTTFFFTLPNHSEVKLA